MQAPNYREFRKTFRATPGRFFLVPANTFDNVKGDFPIGFQIWHTGTEEFFQQTEADVYDSKGDYFGKKNLYSYDDDLFIINWLRQFYNKTEKHYAYLRYLGTDVQNNKGVFLTLKPSDNDIKQVKGNWITPSNIIPMVTYFAVRLSIEADWLNDRDQFLYPNIDWQTDTEFQTDCLVYTLFHGQNRISSEHGTNHWIPFAEEEVDAKEKFESHFMSDFIHGRINKIIRTEEEQKEYEKDGKNYHIADVFAEPTNTTNIHDGTSPLVLSEQAKAVMDAGRELWRYYHQQPIAKEKPNASFYDIRLYFQGTKTTKNGKLQMNTESDDPTYTALISDLRQKQKELAKQIEPKVYEYSFLKK